MQPYFSVSPVSLASDGTDLFQLELSTSVTAWASATWSLFLGFTPVFLFFFFYPHVTYTVTTVVLYWAVTAAKTNLGTMRYCGRTHVVKMTQG